MATRPASLRTDRPPHSLRLRRAVAVLESHTRLIQGALELDTNDPASAANANRQAAIKALRTTGG
jgi:hypothetical protein